MALATEQDSLLCVGSESASGNHEVGLLPTGAEPMQVPFLRATARFILLTTVLFTRRHARRRMQPRSVAVPVHGG